MILVDQSDAMNNKGAGGRPHCDLIAECVNAFVANLAIKCTGSDGVRDWLDLAIIGYRSDPKTGMPILGFHRDKSRSESPLVSIADYAERPAKTTTVVQEFVDEESGETLVFESEMPCWIDPLAQDEPGLKGALDYTERILARWIQTHEESLPPLVWYLTGRGSTTEGSDLLDQMASLTRLRTQNGNVLLAVTYLTAEETQPSRWFWDANPLPSDPRLRSLAQVSSRLPHLWRRMLTKYEDLQPSKAELARLTFVNGTPLALLNCIDFGGS